MSESASISTGIAARYATAVFDLAKEDNALDTLERDVDAVAQALDVSAELRDVISSPIYTRTQQSDALTGLAKAIGLSSTMTNTLALMASKRRLFVLPQLIAALRARIADEKGEVTADVIAATALTDAQRDALAKSLAASVGKTVKINMAVDESLIGGLVVKVGSTMIDTSIKSKLAALQNTLKEVG